MSVEWLAVEFVAVTQQHAEQRDNMQNKRAPQVSSLRRSYYK